MGKIILIIKKTTDQIIFDTQKSTVSR